MNTTFDHVNASGNAQSDHPGQFAASHRAKRETDPGATKISKDDALLFLLNEYIRHAPGPDADRAQQYLNALVPPPEPEAEITGPLVPQLVKASDELKALDRPQRGVSAPEKVDEWEAADARVKRLKAALAAKMPEDVQRLEAAKNARQFATTENATFAEADKRVQEIKEEIAKKETEKPEKKADDSKPSHGGTAVDPAALGAPSRASEIGKPSGPAKGAEETKPSAGPTTLDKK